MSRPWLSSDFRRSSRSNSRSKSKSPNAKKRTRVDEFGRSMPVKSRSRSRSRSHGRLRRSSERGRRHSSRDRGQPAYRSRSRGRDGKDEKGGWRKRRRSNSQSSGDENVKNARKVKVRPVSSTDSIYTCARLFLGNVSYQEMSKADLKEHFQKYGEVIDLLVHPKNYAFVQYSKEEHAEKAAEAEHGKFFQGYKLVVKMARKGNREMESGHKGPRDGPRKRNSFPRKDEHFNDFRPGNPRGPRPQSASAFGGRDPHFPPPDPYRDYPPGPWFPGPNDPYGADPYTDPYRDSFPPKGPPPPPAKVECQICLVSPKLRDYGETIEGLVKEHSIITGLAVMPEGQTASEMLDGIIDNGGLFAVFVNAQNETHRSLTLNILHGTPQEHRNMPMKDAVALIGQSFEEYVDTLREKAKAASGVAPTKDVSPLPSANSSAVFLPASSEVTYLLNLLADNRALTVSELDDVIKYLTERRDKLLVAEGRPRASNVPATPERQSKNTAAANTDDLTHQILSLITSAGGSLQDLIAPRSDRDPEKQQQQSQAHQQQAQHQVQRSGHQQAQGPIQPEGPPAPAPPPPPPPPPPPQDQPELQSPGPTSRSDNLVFNFDNPNVQKALDDLIKSSPVLMQTFSSNVAPTEEPPAPSAENPTHMMGRSSMMGYSQAHSSSMGSGAGVVAGQSYSHMPRMQMPPQHMAFTGNVRPFMPQFYLQQPRF